jgi:hypothetical protein
MFTVEDAGVTETVEIILAWLERENSAEDESAPPGALMASLPEPQAASPIKNPKHSWYFEIRHDATNEFAIVSQPLC